MAEPVITPTPSIDAALVEDGATTTATGTVTATDPDIGTNFNWSVAGGTTASSAAYAFGLDNLTIVRNGVTILNDSFTDGTPPPSMEGTVNGGPTTYAINGSFIESGGRLHLSSSNAATLDGVGTTDPLVGQVATVITNVQAGNPAGLRQATSFTVESRFDLVLPDSARETYGIRLTDNLPTQQGNNSIELSVRQLSDGRDVVQLRRLDFAGDQVTVLGAIEIQPPPGADQIVLRLDHAADSTTITASFDYLAGGTVVGTRSFNATGTAFVGEDWLRAQVIATAPSISDSTLTGTYGVLNIDQAGRWTYSLASDQANVQALAAGQTATDTFTVQVGDGTGLSDTEQIAVQVTGVNDAPTLANAIADQTTTEGATFSFTIPAGTFADVDSGDTRTLSANLGGQTLPSWLAFNAATGTFTATPDFTDAGIYAITVTATDAAGASVSDEFFLTVNEGTPANQPPVADADGPYAATEDTTLVVSAANGVLSGDTDPEGSALTAVLGTPPSFGALTLNADGSFTYVPDTNFSGTDAFNYRARDAAGAFSDVVVVTINVAPVNDPAIIVGQTTGTIDEDAAPNTTSSVLGVSDVDSPATFNAVTNGATNNGYGTFSMAANGQWTYVLDNANPTVNALNDDSAALTDTFTVTSSDGTPQVVTITITGTTDVVANTPPVADADGPYAATEDTTLVVSAANGVLAGDTDPEGGALTAELVTPATFGTIALNADGSFSYQPGANFNGTDSFVYRARDNGGLASADVTVQINVAAVNDGPTFNVNVSDTMPEDSGPRTVSIISGILPGPANEASQAVTFNVTSNNPSLFAVAPAISPSGQLTYTPAPNAFGSATLTITAQDNGGTANGGVDTSAPRTFTINITPVNDPAIITGQTTGTIDEDAVPNTVGGTLTATDIDSAATFNVAANVLTANGYGRYSITAAGQWTYALDNANPIVNALNDASAPLTDTFNVTTADGTAQTVTVTITGTTDVVGNQLPTAANFTVDTAEDTAVTFDARTFASDPDGDALTVTAVSAQSGTAVINANGTITYTPAANVNGSDALTYTVSDGRGGTATASIEVGIAAVNDAPVVAQPIGTQTATVGQLFTFTIPAGTFSDVDGDPLTYSINEPASWLRFDSTTGVFSGTPGAADIGDQSIRLQASDGTAAAAFFFDIVVQPGANQPPVTVLGTLVTAEDTALTFDARQFVTDADADPLTITAVEVLQGGTAVLNANGTITYTPSANASGLDILRYTVTDGRGASVNGLVDINVAAVNDAAVITGQTTGTIDEDAVLNTVAGTLTATDIDSLATFNVAANVLTANGYGRYSITAAGQWTYALDNANPVVNALNDASAPLTDTFTVTTADGTAQTVAVTITGTTDVVGDTPPTIISNGGGATATIAVAENTTAVTTVTATDPDSGQILTYSITGGADASRFAIDATTGALSFLAAPDFEAPTPNFLPPDNLYGVRVTVSDGAGGSDTQDISVTVTDANDQPRLLPGTVGPSLVVNGSFEAGLTGWTQTGGVEAITSSNFSAPNRQSDGLSFANFNGRGGPAGGTLTQTIATAPGKTYVLTFDAGVNGFGNTQNALRVQALDGNGLLLDATLTDPTPSEAYRAGLYSPYEYTFTATGFTTTVRFTDVSLGDVFTVDLQLDRVAVRERGFTIAEGSTEIASISGVDQDAGQILTYSITAGADASRFAINATTGALSFVTAPDFEAPGDVGGNNVYDLTVQVSDGSGGADTRAIAVTVTDVAENTPPTAANFTVDTAEDTAVTFDARTFANDADGDALTVTAVSAQSGTAVINANGTITYTPAANVNGSDALTYTVSDGRGGTATASIEVGITPINDAPTGAPTATLVAGTEDAAYTVSAASLLAGFSDVDGDALSVTGLTASRGTIVDNDNGTWTITQAANVNGPVTLTYTVTDSNGATLPGQSRSYTIAPVNDAATIAGTATGTVTEDGTLTAAGTLTVSDPDTGEAGFRTPASLAGTYGTFTFDAATGAWGYTLDNTAANVQALTAADTRTETLTVTSLDGTATQAISVTVRGVDDGIVGQPGQTTVTGTDGSDQITLLPSNPIANGGAGDDTIALTPSPTTQFHLINGGAGIDTADLSAATTALNVNLAFGLATGGNLGLNFLTSIENVTGGAGNDTLTGNGAGNRLDGAGGNDQISGAGGADVLLGGTGNDTLNGAAGNDSLEGGAGTDSMTGGAGSDTFVFKPGFGNDRVTDFDATPAGGQDFLELSGFGITASNFAARVSVADVGADTLVNIDGDAAQTLRLVGIGNATTVTVDDFRFA